MTPALSKPMITQNSSKEKKKPKSSERDLQLPLSSLNPLQFPEFNALWDSIRDEVFMVMKSWSLFFIIIQNYNGHIKKVLSFYAWKNFSLCIFLYTNIAFFQCNRRGKMFRVLSKFSHIMRNPKYCGVHIGPITRRFRKCNQEKIPT